MDASKAGLPLRQAAAGSALTAPMDAVIFQQRDLWGENAMMALKPSGILVFVFAAMFVLCDPLIAQQTPSELPAELKQKTDALIQKLGDDKYAVREAAHAEVETLLQDTKTLDTLLPYLKQQMDATQNVEVKVRLERITKLYLEFGITSSLLQKFPDIIARVTSLDREVRVKMLRELRQ